jgi:hypothetical protein
MERAYASASLPALAFELYTMTELKDKNFKNEIESIKLTMNRKRVDYT